MITGILGAMDCEIELLHSNMEIEFTKKVAGIEYYVGKINNKDVVLARCGIGKVNATICALTLINKFNATHIINTGVAGGLPEQVSVFDIVLSTNVMHHDLDSDILKSNFPFTSEFTADEQINNKLQEAYTKIANPNYKLFSGRIVSGEVFVSDDNLKRTLLENFSPLCVDMESSAVGHCCYVHSIPFTCIRSLSDKANDGAEMTFEEFAKIAADNSASLLISYLSI